MYQQKVRLRKNKIKMKIIILFILLSYTCLITNCQVIYGYLNYTEYHVGNINIMISIPHDGYLKPRNIPDRTSTDAGIIDYNTWKLGTTIVDELVKLFKPENKMPHLVVNNLHRIKLDPNRNDIECCSGINNDGYRAYVEYHGFIKKFEYDFMELNAKGYKQGLLIDLHGQSHIEDWVELGYLLIESELDRPMLNNPMDSSVRLLDATSPYSFDNLIRGSVSLGGILQTEFGVKTVPSPAHKSPGDGNYFTGGFITRTYGSINCKRSRINAIQLEASYDMRDNTQIANSARIFSKAIYDYYYKHNMDALLTVGAEKEEIDDMITKCNQNI